MKLTSSQGVGAIRRGMQNNTWVKLYRKSLENDIWRYDRNAWHIFEYFLLRADKNTGEIKSSYRTIANYLKISLGGTHKSIERLKKAKMVNASVNANFTIFSILNWQKYQTNNKQVGEPEVNAKQKSGEHIQEEEKRELQEHREHSLKCSLKDFISFNNDDLKPLKEKYPDIDVDQEYESAKNWLEMTGKSYKNYSAFFKNWLIKAKKGFNHKPTTPLKERSEIEIKLLKHLNSVATFNNPEAYLDKIKREFGEKYLPKLLDKELGQWYQYLNFWTKSKA